jgi:hypothetical protein
MGIFDTNPGNDGALSMIEIGPSGQENGFLRLNQRLG